MTVFDRISFELDRRGRTRADLCRASGIDESTIRNWKKTEPKAAMLKKVADALNVTMDYLLTGEGRESPANPLLAYDSTLAKEDIEDLEEIITGWHLIDARGKGNVIDTFRREKTEAEVVAGNKLKRV